MDQLSLSDFFTTKGEAMDFSVRLSTFSEMIYKTDFNLDTSLMAIFGLHKKDKFHALLRDNHIPVDSPNALKDFIAKIQTAISQLPVFSLTVAFEPKEQTLKLIADWFAMNLKKQMIFDFQVDPSLIAGAIITYNGKFKDYSVKGPMLQMIEKLVLESAGITKSTQSTVPPQGVHQNVENFTLGR